MKLIFIYGLPATGKLTVGRALASLTGYKLFHNHLTVDLLLSVFEFGSPSFVELRESIWLSVFERACRDNVPGLIFTFSPEATVRQSFIDEAVKKVTAAGGKIHFVELTCPPDQITARLDSSSRREHKKLTSVELFKKLETSGSFQTPTMPRPEISIDTSRSSPDQAASDIARILKL